MAKKQEPTPEGAPEWLTTYSDLVTLLLTFFVLLFSMATIDKQRFVEVADSLSRSMLKMNNGDSILPGQGNNIMVVDFADPKTVDEYEQTEKYIEDAEEMVVDAQQKIEDAKLDLSKEEIKKTVLDEGLSKDVQVVEEKDYLLVRLDSEVFFDSGSIEIKPQGRKVLDSLAPTLNAIDNEIIIAGHTDNVPVKTGIYQSNWELSTARATHVVKYFVDNLHMNPIRLTATGNGEYRPIGDNNTEEGRRKNRRIEIKILK